MSKLDDFKRVNEPRVARALEQIAHIEKSAASNRVDDNDLRRLLLPLDDKIAELFGEPEGEALPAKVEDYVAVAGPARNELLDDLPMKEVEATPPVAREMEALDTLTTQQLVDRMIACGAELASRRK